MDKTVRHHWLALSEDVRLFRGFVQWVLQVFGLLVVQHLNWFGVL